MGHFYMDKSLLVKIMGFPATLIHGDTLTLDRWLWLKKRLPLTRNEETVLDVGCGSGAFSIGTARRGYKVLGLSWDERNNLIAADRAQICKAHNVKFDLFDIRHLHERNDLAEQFNIVICTETIEHIIDDSKLIRDIVACMKPGGRLLLTTPFLLYYPITAEDKGPFSYIEDGSHVRRGYTKIMLQELCLHAGLLLEDITFCSGFLSQKITRFQRFLSKLHPLLGWIFILPLRVFPPILDWLITPLLQWPYFSICMEAYKPRFHTNPPNGG